MNIQEKTDTAEKKAKTKDHIVGQKYQQRERIGCGSFGSIYLGINIQTQEKVAIKREPMGTLHPQIGYEAKLYKYFQVKCRAPPGFPGYRWFGIDENDFALVMDLLGPSLEDLFNYCTRKFSLKTTLMIADQLIQRIEFVHGRSYIHRDLKPDNFLIGLGKKENIIHIIDFGLAKRYRDPRTAEHIPYSEQKSLTGTARYASIHTHMGHEQSRRDDLESLGYVLMYFVRGSLPWQGLQANTKREKYEQIYTKKVSTSVDDLCRGFPPQFKAYFRYVQALKFEERPDYRHLRALINLMFRQKLYIYDFLFDWTILSMCQNHAYTTPSTRALRAATAADNVSVQQQQTLQITLMQQAQAAQMAQQMKVRMDAANYNNNNVNMVPYNPPQMPMTAAQHQVHQHMVAQHPNAAADPNAPMQYITLPDVQGGGIITQQPMDAPVPHPQQPQQPQRVEGLAADISRMKIDQPNQ